MVCVRFRLSHAARIVCIDILNRHDTIGGPNNTQLILVDNKYFSVVTSNNKRPLVDAEWWRGFQIQMRSKPKSCDHKSCYQNQRTKTKCASKKSSTRSPTVFGYNVIGSSIRAFSCLRTAANVSFSSCFPFFRQPAPIGHLHLTYTKSLTEKHRSIRKNRYCGHHKKSFLLRFFQFGELTFIFI